jgi:hypothetical protein
MSDTGDEMVAGRLAREKSRHPTSADPCLTHRLVVLLANEPRSYREAIAEALRALKSEAEIIAVEPEMLDAEVTRISPHLVICSQASAAVRSSVPSWVELYPGHGRLSHVSVGGQISTVSEMDLEHLFSIVDRAAFLLQTPRPICWRDSSRTA